VADLHILLVVNSETGDIRTGDLKEAPVDSDESVFDDPEWRSPTDFERAVLMDALAQVGWLIDPIKVDIAEVEESFARD